MNAVTELAVLALTRPGPDAPAERVAAWYEAKGRLHEHLAADVGPAEAAGELAYAAAAYEHARRLTRSPATQQPTSLATAGRWAS